MPHALSNDLRERVVRFVEAVISAMRLHGILERRCLLQ